MIETRLLSVNVIEINYHVLVLHGTSGLGLHVRKSLLKANFYLNSDIYNASSLGKTPKINN